MRKNVILIVMAVFVFYSCKNEGANKSVKEIEKQEVKYLSFGENIKAENSISSAEMAEKYKNLKEGDTLNIKFSAPIKEVCKSKGCWMKLDLGNGEESYVNFKDYGFFMPMNADGKEVIVNGKAFVKIATVDELKHLAKDAGTSEEEIAKIKDPKYTLAFEADGVLMKE
ncbi:MAG TPA: DUF4920 domain-containing protein [Lutibacter sp.]|nr:DUF4920 domain-containing protein [Lutibacter sp.]